VLAEGRTWFVIDKPVGLAVHPGPKTPDSLEDLLPAYAPNRPRPQPVHRLDRDTSGCLLIAGRPAALRRLSAAFQRGEVRKLYWALVEQPPEAETGLVDAPLLKRSSARDGWRMVVDPAGKPARTRWTVLERQGPIALIAFAPETGRTHQLRVHATRLGPGAAIMGDSVYGRLHPGGLMLHARALAFPDPDGERTTTVEAPCPDRFLELGFGAAASAR
jgi:tRNA pseudouridine32 synthase/23S rRNA pseudouridine746 synthase